MPNNPVYYMRRAMMAAEKARGFCSPNPFVGAVIVKNSQIIATGFTQCYGSDHAEVQAIKQAGEHAAGADIYVTLEPCSHYGKTPPCAEAIIKAGLKRVFVGIIDPNPLVSGNGIKMLKDAGLEVHLGIHADSIALQLEAHLCYTQKRRPFVTLKTALSLDGKFAAPDGSSQWITGSKARSYVHRLRSANDAVVCGVKTVIIDDPLLNVRIPGKVSQPLRVIVDPMLKLPSDSKIARSFMQYPSLIICTPAKAKSSRANALASMGARVESLPYRDDYFHPKDILDLLYHEKIVSVLLETGSSLAESFFRAKLVDKCLFFFGPKIIGGKFSPYPDLGIANITSAIELDKLSHRRFGNDLLVSAYPKF